MKESKAERRLREHIEQANKMLPQWAAIEAEEAVEAVMDGWAFDGPWTEAEVRQFRAEMVLAVLDAAPRIARCVTP
jgi:hypothetical protein